MSRQEQEINVQDVFAKVGGSANFRLIYDKLLTYYKNSPFARKYHRYSEIDDAFTEILGRGVLLFISSFEKPNHVEFNYDIVLDVFEKARKYRIPVWQKEALGKFYKERSVSIYDVEEASLGVSESAEDEFMKSYMQDMIEKANNAFLSRCCNGIEAIVFTNMVTPERYSVVIKQLQVTFPDHKWDLEALHRIRNSLEYRLAIHYVLSDVAPEKMLLKVLNLHPNLNKYYFDVEKLYEVPDVETLKRIASGKIRPKGVASNTDAEVVAKVRARVKQLFPNATEVSGKSFMFKSKISLDKKSHDHFVTYITDHGWAYDHTTKQSKNILEDVA